MTSVAWPNGKAFAFTVFDDPEGSSEDARKFLYPVLAEFGFRTTKGVWPVGPLREPNCPGETCAGKEYLEDAQRLQEAGFEIGYHNAAPHSSTRAEVIESLEAFRRYFGKYPSAMANHFNADALYWGPARMTSRLRKWIYNAASLGKNSNCFSGHVEGTPNYWADISRERIRYCRNLVYREINTLAACPYTPYHDPVRPGVPFWYSSSEGPDCPSFLKMVAEKNQDKLEEQGGLCIMYTHFGKGFVADQKLDPRFRELMYRLSRKNGWFAPVSTILDYIREKRGDYVINSVQLSELEWKWLGQKVFHGTS